MPLASILVPAFNAGNYLAPCLESALAQTYPAVEIIVVDDGSTDNTLQVARGFQCTRLKVISQANGGQPSALNAAAAVAQGTYIQYLDADDLLHPKKIERQIAGLKGKSPSTIATGPWARFTDRVDDAHFLVEPVWADLDPVMWHVLSWSGGGMMHVAAWLLPRQIIDAVGPWIPELRWAANVDADFFSRALLASDGCAFIPEAWSYYRAVAGSHSSRRDPKSLSATLSVLMRTGEALLAIENSERTRLAFADILQRFIHDTFPAEADLVALAETRIEKLGRPRISFAAGPITALVADLIGWKNAKRLRALATRGRQLLSHPK